MQFNKNNLYFNQLKDDDKIFVSKLLDMISTCEKRFITKFTFFLDERQCKLAENILKTVAYDNYLFYGGFDGAKRNVLGIFSQNISIQKELFPIIAVNFSYRKTDELLHKDFLGAIMSHKIKREVIGDIIVDEGNTVAFIYNTVCDMLINEIDKIGSVGVKVSVLENQDINFSVKQNFKVISGNIAALRIDCILSLATKISREKAALLIKSTGVDINYEKCFSVSEVINKGDVFSLRGFGKFVLSEIGGTSKKGRIYVSINKYM